MAVFKCKMCGAGLEIAEGRTCIICAYCGTRQTLPRLSDERRINLYDRANHFRRNNEFDKAMGIYEQILNEDNTDAEAYWSLVLCRYGIEYVEDPATRSRIPTINRTQFTSIYDDNNYKSALHYADPLQKEIYENEAKTINEIQKGILAISQKEEPFDVFICYKETDNNGCRTPDSVLAQELYFQLKQEGFKVFFSRITLEDKLGVAYEPYIFAALNSSKVMVVLGTRQEYFNAVWVKNEWSRYLSLIKQEQTKILIPAYRDMDPYDLPEEFSHLQAQDMSRLGFMQDLIRGIKKIAQTETPGAPVVKETVISDGNTNIAPLLKRAFMFLEDGEWNRADEFCEMVLNEDPENAQAYLGKMMVDLKVAQREDLTRCDKLFDDNANYKKAVRFADDGFKKELDDILQQIVMRNNEKIYKDAKAMLDNGRLAAAIRLLKRIKNYKDVKVLLEKAASDTSVLLSLAPVSLNGKYGFINEDGQFVIAPQFDGASGFTKNGLAKVSFYGKWGYINETGAFVIRPQFDCAFDFGKNGLAPVELNGKWGCINETGAFVIMPQFDGVLGFTKNGLSLVHLNGKFGYINETGAFVIRPQFDCAFDFGKNGLAPVSVYGIDIWGYINEAGAFVIRPQFCAAWSFTENGLARVKLNGKWGYINEASAFVIRPQFDGAFDFSKNGLAPVKLNDKFGYINETGAFVIQPQFDDVRNFTENGLARVKLNGKWGYVNETGAFVIQPQFDNAWSFTANDLAPVQLNGKWGYVNETGEIAIAAQFDEVFDFTENGLARVKLNGKWGYVNEAGEFVISRQFDNEVDFSIFLKKDIDERNKRCELLNQARLAKINAQIAEAEKALAAQRVIYAENADKIFGAGGKLKRLAQYEIPRLEMTISNLKRQLK